MQILTLLALALALWSWWRPITAALRIGDLAALIAGLGGFSLLIKGEVIPAVIGITGAVIWFLKRQHHGAVKKEQSRKHPNFKDSFSSAYTVNNQADSFKPYSAKNRTGSFSGNFRRTPPPKRPVSSSVSGGASYQTAPKNNTAKPAKMDMRSNIVSRIQKIGIPQNRSDALKLLGLDENADKRMIKKSYHQLIALVHPDAGGTEEWARHVNIARDILLKFNAG